MVIVTFNCDFELKNILEKTAKEYKNLFRNKSHLINQLIIRGLNDLHENNDNKTFSKFLDELFTPKK